MDTDGARDELARELVALEPRTGGAGDAVMRARDWLLGRTVPGQPVERGGDWPPLPGSLAGAVAR